MKTLKAAAKQVVNSIIKDIGYYSDDKPVVVVNNEGSVLISWESGPFEWTQGNYGLHEELSEMGLVGGYKHKDFYTTPEGFFIEPYNSYQLAIHRA